MNLRARLRYEFKWHCTAMSLLRSINIHIPRAVHKIFAILCAAKHPSLRNSLTNNSATIDRHYACPTLSFASSLKDQQRSSDCTNQSLAGERPGASWEGSRNSTTVTTSLNFQTTELSYSA